MRLNNTPRYVALLIVCAIAFAAVTDAHAFYLIVVIPVLAIDAGLTYANANALSKNDPNVVTGLVGLTLGALIATSGAAAVGQSEEPWEVGVSLGITALGVASVIYGWRVIWASRQKDDVAQDGHNVRLIPMLSLGDRNERQFGLVVEMSY